MYYFLHAYIRRSSFFFLCRSLYFSLSFCNPEECYFATGRWLQGRPLPSLFLLFLCSSQPAVNLRADFGPPFPFFCPFSSCSTLTFLRFPFLAATFVWVQCGLRWGCRCRPCRKQLAWFLSCHPVSTFTFFSLLPSTGHPGFTDLLFWFDNFGLGSSYGPSLEGNFWSRLGLTFLRSSVSRLTRVLYDLPSWGLIELFLFLVWCVGLTFRAFGMGNFSL